MRVGSRWRSKFGWACAAMYVTVFLVAYVEYLHHQGTWLADLALNVLAVPYILAGRLVTLDQTFELHGSQPWGLAPALICCAALAYWLGWAIERLVRQFILRIRQ